MDKEKLVNIENDNCVLVQFPNDNFSLAVGFTPWISTKKPLVKDDLQLLIKNAEKVKIWWPRIDIKPVRNMLKKLKSLNDSGWEQCVATILGFGGEQ